MRTRVVARNATSWTGVLDEMGMTLSVTPEHARFDAGYAEWHFDPDGAPFESTYVMCVDESGCVRIGPDAETDGPHLTNDFLDGTTFLLQGLLVAQQAAEEIELEDRTVFRPWTLRSAPWTVRDYNGQREDQAVASARACRALRGSAPIIRPSARCRPGRG